MLRLFFLIFVVILGLFYYKAQDTAIHQHPPQQGAHIMEKDYKKLTDAEWKERLEPDVYYICRLKGTERAGSGKYDKLFDPGIYYCACCGGDFPVFKSSEKFDSKTGWPSFWAPYSPKSVELAEDKGFFVTRTEVRCGRCGSHLGHVFDDGPAPTGERYCMNSLALTFAPEKK